MFSTEGSSFNPSFKPFKSRKAGEIFDSQDPVAKGTGEYVRARSSSLANSADQRLQQSGAFPGSTSHAPGVSIAKEDTPAETGTDTSTDTNTGTDTKPSGPGGSREERWGQATGAEWDAKRSRELEGDLLDKREVWSKIKKGGMSAEELDSWASDNNVKLNNKAQAFLNAKLGKTEGTGGVTDGGGGGGEESSNAGDSESGGGGGAGNHNEGGAADTEGQNAQTRTNRFKYGKAGSFTHKPRDYGAIGTRIADEAMVRADQRDLGELTELRKQIDKHPLYWKSRSDVQTGDYLGDIWNFDIPDFKMPNPLNPVESPDLGGIADDYMDRIDSIKPKL